MLLKNVFLNGKEQNVVIKDGVFAEVGQDAGANEIEVLDATDKAILPTFCNMHTHASMMFLRGIGEDLELFSWLNNEIWPREAKLTPELIYHLSRFALLEMIKTGTTCFLDMYFYTEQTAKAIFEMGLSGALTVCGMDFFDEKRTKEDIEKAERFLYDTPNYDGVIKALSAHAVYTTSETLTKKMKEMARANKTIFTMHASETQKEVDDCVAQTGLRPVELLNKWGVLDENTVLAHAVHLSDDEIKMIKETGAVLAHNPASNLKLNSGQMPIQKYLDAGLKVTLGTDSVSSNNSLSMIFEMKTAALSGKNIADDSTAAKVGDIFKIATKNGFEALHINAGEIKAGARADFMLVDLNNHALLPNFNLISNMVYSADSSVITDVFCNGKQVMKDGRVKGEKEIISEFKKACTYF